MGASAERGAAGRAWGVSGGRAGLAARADRHTGRSAVAVENALDNGPRVPGDPPVLLDERGDLPRAVPENAGDGSQGARIRLQGEIPSALKQPAGCVFQSRCPRKIGAICETEEPALSEAEPRHAIRCHIPPDALMRDGELITRVIEVYNDRDNRPPEPIVGPSTREEFLAQL